MVIRNGPGVFPKQQNLIMVFRAGEKEYWGNSALEIVGAIEADEPDYPHRGRSIREFLFWSLGHLGNRIPPRETDLRLRIEDEALALNYLYLRDEYGAGKLSVIHQNGAA